MKLSAKMPATMDSTLPAKMDASMPSDSQQTGGGGSMNPPAVPVTQDNPGGVEEMNIDRKGEDWQTNDFGSQGWETQEKKVSDTSD